MSKKKSSPTYLQRRLEDQLVSATLEISGLRNSCRDLTTKCAALQKELDDMKRTQEPVIKANMAMSRRLQHNRLLINRLNKGIWRESTLKEGWCQVAHSYEDVLERIGDPTHYNYVAATRTDANMALQEAASTKGAMLACMLPKLYLG